MKKMFSFLLVISIMLSCVIAIPTASAVTLKSGNYEYKLLDDGTVSIVKYLGKYGKKVDLKIPSKLEGKKVTHLGRYVFWNKNFNTVTIPDTVTRIHSEAFTSHIENLVI
ncbi:hypothetical protein IJ818_06960, partial [bacterium]|nr:hypothetical protein [bacterium]